MDVNATQKQQDEQGPLLTSGRVERVPADEISGPLGARQIDVATPELEYLIDESRPEGVVLWISTWHIDRERVSYLYELVLGAPGVVPAEVERGGDGYVEVPLLAPDELGVDTLGWWVTDRLTLRQGPAGGPMLDARPLNPERLFPLTGRESWRLARALVSARVWAEALEAVYDRAAKHLVGELGAALARSLEEGRGE